MKKTIFYWLPGNPDLNSPSNISHLKGIHLLSVNIALKYIILRSIIYYTG